ncbi:MAG: SDR family NAD(P)-dependent oxidoreductase, partial [Desulfobacteraceae bacterium]|nr:SDR family NAD(P)-dependent oxidoreductase [Desulfobacteraceae bacterium]
EAASARTDPAREVRYEGGKRLVRSFRTPAPAPDGAAGFREGGVYLITGGAGGLGTAICRYLTETYHARVILAGRSPLDGGRRERIDGLRRSGADVTYVQADVTDPDAVSSLIRDIRTRAGRLNGVLHAAGLFSEPVLTETDRSVFESVLAPKTAGTINLDHATQNELLDCFVLFSSASAVLGDFGQCSYAVANRFLDGYARYRETLRADGKRWGKTLSINWPLWRKGGMHRNDASEQFYLKTSGLAYLETKDGLNALEKALRHPRPQTVVLTGDRRRIQALLDGGPPEGEFGKNTGYRGPRRLSGASDGGGRLADRVCGDIRIVAADILQAAPEELDIRENLGNFGFDSLTLKQFAEALERRFHVQLQPSIFFSHSDIASLGDHLLDAWKEPLMRLYGDRAEEMSAGPAGGEVERPAAVVAHSGIENAGSRKRWIAVVGAYGLFPGSGDLTEFWSHLEAGDDLVTRVPRDRWDRTDPDVPEIDDPTGWGGFITGVDRFDPLFFAISPREAQLMDPQHRLFLECVWKTVEDAGYSASALSGKRVGVFAGIQFNDYEQLLIRKWTGAYQMATGNARTMLANRVSFQMNWQGPSETIDTACSSSLVAVHRAVASLRAGECELAVAGGVSLLLTPGTLLAAARLGVLSPSGRCRTFDKDADGYVKGEGLGAVLLKPLERAVRDRDHVYGVIRGSAVNHGGRAHSLTAPNARAQAKLLRAAFADACVDPRTLSYIEVHGTGTELGDPVEVDGIRQAFETGNKGVDTAKVRKTCGLGTVKTNIGHLEPAAGIAGLLKVLLALKHGKLPATLHLRQVNKYISLEDTPLYIVETTRPWARIQTPENGEFPRRAGISSFGFGGTNAHVVVEEYRGPADRLPPPDGREEAQLIVLSARNEERLNVYAERMAEFLRIENRKSTIENIAYTLQTGREAMSERLALVADSVDDLKKKLSGFVRGERDGSGVFRGAVSHRPSDATELVRGEEGEAFVGMLLQNRNLDKLARLWVSGTEPDWAKLHGDSARRRIPLPTYPFAAERYWIPEPDADSTLGVNGRHPLIDEVDLSSSLDRGIVFGKTLKPTDPIVRDHRVRHQPLMPGDAYLEMVHAAQSMVEPGRRYKFVRLVWRKPLAVDRAEKRVALLLRRKADHLAFTVQEREGPKPTVYATGELHPVETAEGSEPPRMSIEAIQAACTLEMEKLPFYRRFRDMGVTYGDCFMGVQHIWGNDREALGRLCLPAAAREQLPRMTFNPSLTDSALQTIAGIGLSHNSGAQPIRVHYAVDEVELLHPLPAEGYAHARQVDRDRFDVSVLDHDGRICLRFNGIRVGEIPDPLQGLLFKPRWVPVLPVSDPTASSVAEPEKGQQTTLIFYPPVSMGLEKALAALYPEDRVHRIRLGRRNRVYSRHAREIDVHDPEGPARCLNGFSRIHRVFFLGGRPGSQAEPDDLETLAAIQEAGIITLFRLVRSLVRDPSVDAAPTLTVLTHDGYGFGPDSPVNPYSGSLTGFTRVLALECPRLHAAVVDVRLKGLPPKPKPSRLKDLLLPVVEHVDRSRRPVEAVLEQGRWYERILEPVRLPFTDRIPFRDRGVYLILGGAGGIGIELGKYLAGLVHARLVLVGRRPMDDGVKERMARIEAAGGEVLYIRADAADLQGMKEAVAEAKSRFGRINGVFHSAIVLKDRSLAAMDEETFRDALAPKVAGSVVLYRVFRSEPIDFMVFFSSLQSLTGNPGQSNYAAACSFKDAYALYLRKKAAFPVRLVNWGYWGSVGIVADTHHRKRMADQGVGSVEPEEGLEAIRRILNHRIPQAAPFRMDPKTMDAMGIDRSYELVLYPDADPSVFDAVVARIRNDAVKKKRPPSSSSALDELDRFGRSLLWDAFQRMGVFRKSGETTTLERLAQAASVAPGHHRLLEALVELLIRAGWLERLGREVKTCRIPSASDHAARLEGLDAEKDRLCSAHPDLSPHIRLLWTCLSRYPEILTGNTPATEILFENAGLGRVEGIYKNNAGADSYNRLVADAVGAFVASRIAHLPEKEKIRILEIGAGTGGTSDAVLRALEPYANRVHFIYTDISRRFVQHGKKHYGDRSFADFRVLDIEGDSEDQGYGPGTCDLVLATNVFHATRNIRHTLRNAKCLLKTHGCLVLNETTKVIEFNTLTFGLLEGWWK